MMITCDWRRIRRQDWGGGETRRSIKRAIRSSCPSILSRDTRWSGESEAWKRTQSRSSHFKSAHLEEEEARVRRGGGDECHPALLHLGIFWSHPCHHHQRLQGGWKGTCYWERTLFSTDTTGLGWESWVGSNCCYNRWLAHISERLEPVFDMKMGQSVAPSKPAKIPIFKRRTVRISKDMKGKETLIVTTYFTPISKRKSKLEQTE